MNVGPLDPDVRPARQRQILDLQRHPRCDGRQDLRPPRARIFRPGHHRLRPDRPRRAQRRWTDPNSLRRTANRFDNRYVLCDRPTVITGGELSLDMLDLTYNPVARTYQAPLQMKSTGGVFIVDDLGRQTEPPQSARQPLDRPAGGRTRHPRPAVGREVRRALRHAGDLLHQLPPQRDLRQARPCAGSSTRSRSTGRTRTIS